MLAWVRLEGFTLVEGSSVAGNCPAMGEDVVGGGRCGGLARVLYKALAEEEVADVGCREHDARNSRPEAGEDALGGSG